MYFIFTNEIKYRREAPLKPRKKGAKRHEFLVCYIFARQFVIKKMYINNSASIFLRFDKYCDVKKISFPVKFLIILSTTRK